MKRYTRLGEQSFTTNISTGDDNQDLVSEQEKFLFRKTRSVKFVVFYSLKRFFLFEICVGYRRSLGKLCFFAFFSIISCGFLLLLRRWRPRWTVGLQYSKCSLEISDVVLLSVSIFLPETLKFRPFF